jgi:hypothetical protein
MPETAYEVIRRAVESTGVRLDDGLEEKIEALADAVEHALTVQEEEEGW